VVVGVVQTMVAAADVMSHVREMTAGEVAQTLTASIDATAALSEQVISCVHAVHDSSITTTQTHTPGGHKNSPVLPTQSTRLFVQAAAATIACVSDRKLHHVHLCHVQESKTLSTQFLETHNKTTWPNAHGPCLCSTTPPITSVKPQTVSDAVRGGVAYLESVDCDGSCVLMIDRADVEHDVLSGTVLVPFADDVNTDDANMLWTAISQLQATLQATTVGTDDALAAPVDFWAWRKINRFEVRRP
jgi:hypothetical protein